MMPRRPTIVNRCAMVYRPNVAGRPAGRERRRDVDTVRERALKLVTQLRADLYSNTGKPTREMKMVERDDFKLFVNMSQNCAGSWKMRGVVVRRLDGEEVCERFGWTEVAAALDADWTAANGAAR